MKKTTNERHGENESSPLFRYFDALAMFQNDSTQIMKTEKTFALVCPLFRERLIIIFVKRMKRGRRPHSRISHRLSFVLFLLFWMYLLLLESVEVSVNGIATQSSTSVRTNSLTKNEKFQIFLLRDPRNR